MVVENSLFGVQLRDVSLVERSLTSKSIELVSEQHVLGFLQCERSLSNSFAEGKDVRGRFWSRLLSCFTELSWDLVVELNLDMKIPRII